MSLYVIADPHLSFGTNKPMDIFKGWADYSERLRENWCSVVSDGDTVVLPGDISWASDFETLEPDFDFLNALPGAKIIGKGNHDYWWCTMNKLNGFVKEKGYKNINFLFNNAYRVEDVTVCGTRGWFFDDTGFKEDVEKIIAREAGRLERSLEAGVALGGKLTAFLHYPVCTEENINRPIMDVLKKYGVERCYFGHLHGERTGRYADYFVENIRFSLVSADFLSFCPKKVILY